MFVVGLIHLSFYSIKSKSLASLIKKLPTFFFMASSCFLRSILFSSPTNLTSSRSHSRSVFFPKNLTCSFPFSGSRFESVSVSSIRSGSSRRLADSRRKVSEVRSMATTAPETGKDEKKRVEIFDTEENLAADLAKFTADLSDKFCKERGAFTVVVSGGSLIKSLRWVLTLWDFRFEATRLLDFRFGMWTNY